MLALSERRVSSLDLPSEISSHNSSSELAPGRRQPAPTTAMAFGGNDIRLGAAVEVVEVDDMSSFVMLSSCWRNGARGTELPMPNKASVCSRRWVCWRSHAKPRMTSDQSHVDARIVWITSSLKESATVDNISPVLLERTGSRRASPLGKGNSSKVLHHSMHSLAKVALFVSWSLPRMCIVFGESPSCSAYALKAAIWPSDAIMLLLLESEIVEMYAFFY